MNSEKPGNVGEPQWKKISFVSFLTGFKHKKAKYAIKIYLIVLILL